MHNTHWSYSYYRYQDDWLKTSASCLQVWEKAPLEPYATAKHVRPAELLAYHLLCRLVSSPFSSVLLTLGNCSFTSLTFIVILCWFTSFVVSMVDELLCCLSKYRATYHSCYWLFPATWNWLVSLRNFQIILVSCGFFFCLWWYLCSFCEVSIMHDILLAII